MLQIQDRELFSQKVTQSKQKFAFGNKGTALYKPSFKMSKYGMKL